MSIYNNLSSLISYNALKAVNGGLAKSVRRISSDLRINGAADDAAGPAVSERFRAQIRSTVQASRNKQDSISMIQTADGGLSETQDLLKMKKCRITEYDCASNYVP